MAILTIKATRTLSGVALLHRYFYSWQTLLLRNLRLCKIRLAVKS